MGKYGKLIKVRHNSNYTTYYAHLSRFKKGLKKGRRVKQGQVIGYVGSTGGATGPHLHYEIRVKGKLVDPLKIKSKPRRTLVGETKADFMKVKETLLARFNASKSQVASAK